MRAAAAGLMGVPVTDVAFVKNTTEGLGFVASGLDWAPGDRVLVPEDEFPSTAYPWLALEHRGVVVDRVAPHELAAAVATGPPPKVVATQLGPVRDGAGGRPPRPRPRLPRRRRPPVRRRHPGPRRAASDFEAWGVDVAAAAGHKWLLGPEGAGVLYVRGEHLDRLRVLEPGWNSAADRDAYDDRALVLDPTARRLEGGSAEHRRASSASAPRSTSCRPPGSTASGLTSTPCATAWSTPSTTPAPPSSATAPPPPAPAS